MRATSLCDACGATQLILRDERNTHKRGRYLFALLSCTAHWYCPSCSWSRNANEYVLLYIVCKTLTPSKAVVCENGRDYKKFEGPLKPWLISRACWKTTMRKVTLFREKESFFCHCMIPDDKTDTLIRIVPFQHRRIPSTLALFERAAAKPKPILSVSFAFNYSLCALFLLY